MSEWSERARACVRACVRARRCVSVSLLIAMQNHISCNDSGTIRLHSHEQNKYTIVTDS